MMGITIKDVVEFAEAANIALSSAEVAVLELWLADYRCASTTCSSNSTSAAYPVTGLANVDQAVRDLGRQIDKRWLQEILAAACIYHGHAIKVASTTPEAAEAARQRILALIDCVDSIDAAEPGPPR